MKAIVCKRYGSADVLQVRDLPEPKPRTNQVLIQVKACSVNPVDWKIRSGALIIKTGLKPPKILGSDFAGVIKPTGSQVNEYRVGDEVWGKFDSFKGGAYAQMVVANSKNISKKPKNLDFFQAASMPNVALTALQAMINKGHLHKGQHVMVNGASGGVGQMAVQIAKAMDCHVTAVCSGKNKALVESLGADTVLDYQTQDILRHQQTYDVFFDCVANQSYLKVRKTLKTGGVHVKTTPDLFSMLGLLLRPFISKVPDHIMVKPSHQDLLRLKEWVESEQLKPMIEQVFPMEDVAAAHQLSQAGRVVGKLILDLS